MGFMITKIVRMFFLSMVLTGSCMAQLKPPIYEKYVDEIIRDFIQEIERDYGFICVGDGGSMPYTVAEIDVMFHVYRKYPTSIEEARRLEVALTERLTQMINAHEEIRPYLAMYPFEPECACISLSFMKDLNSSFTDGSVAYVFHGRYKLFYDTQKPDGSLEDLFSEPYADAVKKVEEEKTSSLKAIGDEARA